MPICKACAGFPPKVSWSKLGREIVRCNGWAPRSGPIPSKA
jgi:hypothetical protein